MKTISASDAKQSFAAVLEAAARGPVLIRKHQRDAAVVLSMQEYERLARLNVAEFQRFCDQVGSKAARKGMNEAILAKLLAGND
ncbi:MAG: type II toxin-antitoxin system Phd/YefM family antitoxin [Gammaproteobacteria bacterium]|nr:MAG: type II toxin-antitoxin system Phd/YefM family antitoxin [Gammaproteobacteria bacterium]